MRAPAQDDEAQLPSLGLVLAMLALVAVAAVVAIVIYDRDAALNLDPTGFAVFAPLYVAAQAIERLLEPLASRLNPTNDAKDDVKQARETKLRVVEVARAMAVAAPTQVNERGLPAVADAPDVDAATRGEQRAVHRLRRKRAERRVIWWALASVAGLLLCGALGLGILEAMSSDTSSWTDLQHDIDIILTGLVIGAGTKPLHDLIARLEKAKDNADPATKPTAKLPGTPSP